MIWRDIVVREALPDGAIARALTAAFGERDGPVVVSSDIETLGGQGVFALKTSETDGTFGLTLSIYTASPVSDSSAMLRAIAQHMGSAILTSEDESADPYCMRLFDSRGSERQVRLSATALDERGEYVVEDLETGSVEPVARVRSSVMAGEKCPETGYWFTPAKKGSRRYFVAGQPMPLVLTDYGTSLWQWDDDQTP